MKAEYFVRPLIVALLSLASARCLAAENILETDPLVAKALRAALVMQRFSWEQGVLAQCYVEAGDEAMIVTAARAMAMRTNAVGCVAASGGSFVDPLMCGEALLRAAQISKDPALLAAHERMLDCAKNKTLRTSDGIICHHDKKKNVWADTANTAAPYFAVSGEYAEAVRQLRGIFKELWNPQTKLLVHFWDDDRKKQSDASPWGCGAGWYCVAATRVIRALPATMPQEKQELAGLLRQVLDGTLAHQRPDGLFHNLVDRPDSFAEACAGEMLAFAIFESVRGGWLPASYLSPAGKMRAAARARVDADGFVHQVCGAPGFNSPGISPEAQAFFVMMEIAAKKYEATTGNKP